VYYRSRLSVSTRPELLRPDRTTTGPITDVDTQHATVTSMPYIAGCGPAWSTGAKIMYSTRVISGVAVPFEVCVMIGCKRRKQDCGWSIDHCILPASQG